MKVRLKRWLNDNAPDYNKGKNVVVKSNPLYVAAIRECIERGEKVEFPVKGWSMRIFVEHERDKAVLAPCDKAALKVGDVVLASIGPEVYALHRIIAIDGENLTLMGDGNLKGTENTTRNQVIAIVTAWRRKGNQELDYVTDRKWRVYSKIWLSLLPVRRYLLLAWRVLRRLHLVA